MRLIVLGSGSSGNVLYVESGATSALIDLGLSAKETARRMTEAGVDPTRLSAIVITHEHSDHVKGARVFAATAEVPVFMTQATRAECNFPENGDKIPWGETIASGEPFQIGSLNFYPFTIPHDGVDTFAQFNGSNAVYQDNVQSYSTVEPAIDLTASSPLAFARQAAGIR